MIKNNLEPAHAAKFSEYDIIKTLFKLEQEPYGRNTLMQALRLSEASTRSLMRKLKELGYVKNSTRGIMLSADGLAKTEKIHNKIVGPVVVDNFEKNSIAFKVNNAASKVRIGIEQRDAAVRAGATGALVLVYTKGKLCMPGVLEFKKENTELMLELKEKLKPRDEDALVIVFSTSKKCSGEGAWSAVKTLF